MVALVDGIGIRRWHHGRRQLGALQQALGGAAARCRHDQYADALAPGASGAAAAMQKRLGIVRQVGVDNEVEIGQIDTARRNIGCNADTGTAIAHRLQGVGALGLAEFARKGNDGKAAIGQAAGQVLHRFAGRAENDGVLRIVEEQGIDDGVFALTRRHRHDVIFDIRMLLAVARGGNAQGVFLELLGKQGDGFWYRRREHQGAAVFGRFAENKFEVFAETEIEHLVGFIEDDCAQFLHVERTAGDMVAQTAGCTDDDMRALLQRAALLGHVHAANAGGNARAGRLVEPFEFAPNLQCQFARRGDDQCVRCANGCEAVFAFKQGRCDGDTEGDSLAGSSLGGDQKVGALGFRSQNSGLHRRQGLVATGCQCTGQRRGDRIKNSHQ